MSDLRARLGAVLLALATVLTGLVVGAAPASAATLVGPGPIITSGAVVGNSHVTPFVATGGEPPYSFEMTSGLLPPGLAYNEGSVRGRPTQDGEYRSFWRLTDSGTPTQTVTFQLIIDVDPPVVSVARQSGASGVVGQAFSRAYSVTGGFAPTTLALTPTSAGLPPGTSLARTDDASGRIHAVTGVPTQSGSFRIDYTGTDDLGYRTTSADVIAIEPPTLTLSPAAGDLPGGELGTSYRQEITTAGGIAPHAYGVTAGALPDGLVLSPGGVLSGTPTAAGDFDFTVTTTSSSSVASTGEPHRASATYRIVVERVVTLAPSRLPAGTVGVTYDRALTADGGVSPYLFVVTDGELPDGLRLSSAGRLHGTPTEAGTSTVEISAIDSTPGGRLTSTPRTYDLVVEPPTIAVSPTTLPDATSASAYSQQLSATGGTAPYTFTIVGGELPAGLGLTATGHLHGTPTGRGTTRVVVRVEDSSTGTDAPFTVLHAYDVTVQEPAITLSPGTVPDATVGTAYSQSLTASGGVGPHTFVRTAGDLPLGLSLTGAGVLVGTPQAGGTFDFTVRATDGSGATGSRDYTLTVAAPTIAVSPTSLPAAARDAAYAQLIEVAGGTGPWTFSVTGDLPPGLTLTDRGVLAGWPTRSGAFTFTVGARDSSRGTGPYSGSRSYTLVVDSPTISVSTTTLPGATAGTPYGVSLRASGGRGDHAYAVTAGRLPAGLTLDPTGRLAGTPTEAGTFPMTVTATDADGFTGSAGLTLTVVNPAPTGGGGGETPATAPILLGEPRDVTVRPGADVILRAAAAGQPAPTVQWQVDDGTGWRDLAGAVQPDLTLPTVTRAQHGSAYRAVFTNDAGTVTTRAAVLSVGAAPEITRQPADLVVALGEDGVLTAAATGEPAPTVRWQVEAEGAWTDVPGATGDTLTLPAVTAGLSGTRYRAVFSNGFGEPAVSAPATVTVVAAPAVTRQPVDRTARAGGRAVFRAGASGLPAPAAQWQVFLRGQWRDVAEATGRRLVLTGVRPGWADRRYRAVFTNAAGSVTTDEATLDVRRRVRR